MSTGTIMREIILPALALVVMGVALWLLTAVAA